MTEPCNIRVEGVKTPGGSLYYKVQEGDCTAYVSARTFVERPSETKGQLMEAGIIPTPPKRWTYIVSQLNEVAEFHEALVFDRIGHNGRSFVYPDGTVISQNAGSSGSVICETAPDIVHETGSLKRWLAGVATPLVGHQICEFFMMIPFAGPLRRYTTRTENFGWGLAGSKEAGKSVLLQLMASACGGSLGGEEGSFQTSFNATAAGIETLYPLYSDQALIIDELNLFAMDQAASARARSLTQLLMALGRGQEKQRHKEKPREFRFVFATASNETLKDVIGCSVAEEQARAAADRLMTLPIFDRQFGVFDRIPRGYKNVADFIAALIDASARNHGVAMRHYLRGLVTLVAEDPDEFSARLKGHIEHFRKKVVPPKHAGPGRRIADSFGLVYAAGRLAQHVGALPQEFDPLQSAIACYEIHRAYAVPERAPDEIIRRLVDDPDTIDLDQGLPSMSKAEFRATKAFKRTNRQGSIEILVTKASIARLIPHWNWARKGNPQVARLLHLGERDRCTVKRRVRRDAAGDRVVCFVL